METKQHCLIVGLGNPEKKYSKTRHNVGFMAIETLARHWGITFKEEKRLQGLISRTQKDGVSVRLLMPTTYMNNSGLAVRKCSDYFGIGPENILVICDDIALPFGHLRLRPQGGSGGHNGLKDISSRIGSTHYPRLRIGINGQYAKDLKDYVLKDFSATEMRALPEVLERSTAIAQQWVLEDVYKVMNDVNAKLTKKEKNLESPKGIGEQ
ncbi:MAG: aminoacyl-tRNA hydrolase [Chlamydiota bacterium]